MSKQNIWLTVIKLPRNFTTFISGLGVYYPDGTCAQRKGVKIDYVVKPTLQGIKSGCEELLEEAIKLLNRAK